METQYNLSLLKLNIPVNQTNGTDCVDGVQWVYAVMGECCITAREQASAYLGVASLVLWGLVGFPQMCKNFCHIDGMAGLSFLLILQWAGGDLANLTGCLLTRQNNFQIILAGYFVGMDVLLLLQFLYYFCIHKKRRADLSEDRKDLIGRQKSPKPVLCLMGVFAISSFIGKHYMWSVFTNTAENNIHPSHVSRSLLSVYEVDDVKDPLYWNNPRNVIGYLMGVVSAVFYLGSRVSQIYKNVKARSTEGLAFLTFTLAVFGNLTYGGQIVILDFSQDYIIEKLPWLLGSFGVVFLDCTILIQFVYYRKNNQIRTAEEEALLTGEYIINADDENSQDEQTENQHDIN